MGGARRPRLMRIDRLPGLVATATLVAMVTGCAVVTTGSAPVGAGSVEVRGQVSAGPICPVVTEPPQSGCADRPVAGAVILILASGGAEAARVTSGEDGRFRVLLVPGRYRVIPQPVEGLMGTAPEQTLAVRTGTDTASMTVTYDTGIR